MDTTVQVSRPSSQPGDAQVRRLDVARGAEKGGSSPPERGDSDEEPASRSLSERERLRELFAQDMQIRVAEAAIGLARARMRGSPSFKVEHGPLGRAYAVGEGVRYERRIEGEANEASEVDTSAEPAPLVVASEDEADDLAEADERTRADTAETEDGRADEERGVSPESSGTAFRAAYEQAQALEVASEESDPSQSEARVDAVA